MYRFYRRRKWIMLAAATLGTVTQLATCQSELALFGLRTAFSAFSLPINELLRQFFANLGI